MECVPNVSEGRRLDVIDRLVGSVRAVTRVCLLDVHSDPDHNRSVLTMAGPPSPIQEAALTLAAAAVELIDMREHRGVHPRIGAIDVIPFVPLSATGMPGCVELARDTGRRLADELNLPVILYGAAAPQRRALATIRRGGFEIARSIGHFMVAPDFGPSRPHPTAGGVAVGARPPLLAFNLLLETDDAGVARRVARGLRQSSGGLPGVQAMGLALGTRGQAQVSTNLLDYRLTSLAEVIRATRRLAAEAGVEVASAELVGLAPRDALGGLEPEALGGALPGLPGEAQTIEARLEACPGYGLPRA